MRNEIKLEQEKINTCVAERGQVQASVIDQRSINYIIQPCIIHYAEHL